MTSCDLHALNSKRGLGFRPLGVRSQQHLPTQRFLNALVPSDKLAWSAHCPCSHPSTLKASESHGFVGRSFKTGVSNAITEDIANKAAEGSRCRVWGFAVTIGITFGAGSALCS